jgi:hypothetical protein
MTNYIVLTDPEIIHEALRFWADDICDIDKPLAARLRHLADVQTQDAVITETEAKIHHHLTRRTKWFSEREIYRLLHLERDGAWALPIALNNLQKRGEIRCKLPTVNGRTRTLWKTTKND